MTALRLVPKNNVAAINTGFLPHIPQAVRALADCVEDGTIDAKKVILVTLDSSGAVDLSAFGEPVGNTEVLGILELAKAKLLDEARK